MMEDDVKLLGVSLHDTTYFKATVNVIKTVNIRESMRYLTSLQVLWLRRPVLYCCTVVQILWNRIVHQTLLYSGSIYIFLNLYISLLLLSNAILTLSSASLYLMFFHDAIQSLSCKFVTWSKH